ncbi:MAG: FAD-binding oxidoreductase [bacterium]|jgi:hypothetical protein
MLELMKRIVGETNFSQDDFELWCYSRDAGSLLPKKPEAVVVVDSVTSLVKIMRLAHRYKKPVIARGAASSMCGAPNPVEEGTVMLDLTKLQGIEVNEDSMTVTVETGVTWGQLNAYLAEKGWEIGLEGPWSAPSATIGGTLAVHAICMGAARYGTLGTQVVGLEVVLPDGTLLRTGSAANPNNHMVTRDCNGADLTGLFLGSHGTLGIITKAALKIYPLSTGLGYGAYSFATIEDTIEATYGLAKHGLVYDCRVFVRPVPTEIGGTAGLVFMTKALSQAAAQDLTMKAKETCNNCGGKEIEPFGQEYYEGRNDARVKAFGKAGPGWLEVAGFLPIRKYPKVAKVVLDYFAEHQQMLDDLAISWSLGGLLETRSINIPMALFCNEKNKETWNRMIGVLEELAEIMFAQGVSPYWIGHLSPFVMWKLGPTYELYKRIKAELDPNNVLNPGML